MLSRDFHNFHFMIYIFMSISRGLETMIWKVAIVGASSFEENLEFLVMSIPERFMIYD